MNYPANIDKDILESPPCPSCGYEECKCPLTPQEQYYEALEGLQKAFSSLVDDYTENVKVLGESIEKLTKIIKLVI